jgi:hypothetical protein
MNYVLATPQRGGVPGSFGLCRTARSYGHIECMVVSCARTDPTRADNRCRRASADRGREFGIREEPGIEATLRRCEGSTVDH